MGAISGKNKPDAAAKNSFKHFLNRFSLSHFSFDSLDAC
jgi:hypothetical protein